MSNRRLVEEFGLSPALPDLQPRPAPRYQHRQRWQGADELTTFGLRSVARLLKNEVEESKKPRRQPLLSTKGSDVAVDLLARSRVTLHLESPETALWAACYPDRLPVLLSKGVARSDRDTFLKMKLPSDIIRLSKPEMWPGILGPHVPEVVVIPPDVSLDGAAVCREWAQNDVAFVFLGHDLDVIAAAADRLGLVCQTTAGKTHVFRRSEVLKLGAPE